MTDLNEAEKRARAATARAVNEDGIYFSGDALIPLLVEYDRRADRDQLAADTAGANYLRHQVMAALHEQDDPLPPQLDDHALADEAATVIRATRRDADRDQLHTALTELRAASRGLAFFDQIKCARWNAAYHQATQVLGLKDET